MDIRTDPKMPPFGVAEALVDPAQHGPDLFRFWLLSHSDTHGTAGVRFWRTATLREALPTPDAELHFEALAEPLR